MASDNRRQDFRIDDIIPMHDQRLTKEEFDFLSLQIGGRSRQSAMLQEVLNKDIFTGNGKENLSSELSHALETIDAKLNYLIGINMMKEAEKNELDEKAVNLSITGASFHTEKPYKEGDYISLVMMLPSFPPSEVELIGHITWVRKGSSKQNHIGVRFHYRSNEEESHIAKHVFKRQREMIRLRAKEREEQEFGS